MLPLTSSQRLGSGLYGGDHASSASNLACPPSPRTWLHELHSTGAAPRDPQQSTALHRISALRTAGVSAWLDESTSWRASADWTILDEENVIFLPR